MILVALLSMLPLVLILFYIVKSGSSSLNWHFLIEIPKAVGEKGGGIANAIVGSALLVVIAGVTSIPLAIAAGGYVSEHKESQLAALLSLHDLEAINPAPAVTFKGSITAGGSLTDGNTETKATNASANFEAGSERHRFTIGLKYNYGETEGEITARNATGSFKYDFFLTKKLFSYAQSLFERDDMQDLTLRSTLGLGLGYQILDSKRASLFAETGVSYFNEDYAESKDEQYTAARWSVGLGYEVVPERVKFFHLHEGYYSLEESGAYYVRSEQGFRLPLVRNFFANFQVDYSYNSEPAPGKEKFDVVYIFGLAYEYEF